MKIEIDIKKDRVYYSHFPPSGIIDFADVQGDINEAMDRVSSAFYRTEMTSVTVKINHYNEEVGTLTFSKG